MSTISRRNFLQTSLLGGIAAAALPGIHIKRSDIWAAAPGPQVALTSGDSCADITFRGLEEFSEQIARAIGNKLVVIKPNMVSTGIQLAATYAETLEGTLEFLKSIRKLDQAVIAESAADGPAMGGYSNFGYVPLAQKYGVKLIDLDEQPHEVIYVFNETDFRPHAVRVSKMLLDDNSYVISAARMKTHDRVIATLSLKNIVFGAPVKDPGFAWGPRRREGARSDKAIVHGGGFRGINYNLFQVGRILHPDLAVIDGFVGMEGNGPTGGTPVDHRVCVVSPDWYAADRVAIELMGIDFSRIGYLNYFADAGLGEADLSKIEILGEPIERHKKKYKLHERNQEQSIGAAGS